MSREEIIRLARESELLTTTGGYQVWMPDNLEAFAALVAASEREACAKAAEDYADYQRSFSDWGDEYAELRAMGALEVMDRISARGQE